MVADPEPDQNLFQRRRQLPRAEQQRGRLVGEGVDDVGAVGQCQPVMQRDVGTGLHFG